MNVKLPEVVSDVTGARLLPERELPAVRRAQKNPPSAGRSGRKEQRSRERQNVPGVPFPGFRSGTGFRDCRCSASAAGCFFPRKGGPFSLFSAPS
jgi:hypothetical protein